MEIVTPINTLLSKNEAVNLLELINSTLLCQEESEITDAVTNLSNYMAFNFSVCALATVKNGQLEAYNTLNINYPKEWLQLYKSKEYHSIDPIVDEHFKKFKIQTWEETYRIKKASPVFIAAAEDFDLKAGYTHGFKTAKGNQCSLFSFAGPSVEYHPRNNEILSYFLPHLHQALLRVLGHVPAPLSHPLTLREKEILNWIKRGKCSWDISTICGISLRTVNFHSNNIKEKLNAVSRAHAVAVAFEHGLIDVG